MKFVSIPEFRGESFRLSPSGGVSQAISSENSFHTKLDQRGLPQAFHCRLSAACKDPIPHDTPQRADPVFPANLLPLVIPAVLITNRAFGKTKPLPGKFRRQFNFNPEAVFS